MKARAEYNLVNDRLFLWPEGRLSDEEYQAIRAAGFVWWPRGCFTAVWSPHSEDHLLAHYVSEITEVEEADDVDGRVERYETHAENASQRGQAAHEKVQRICDGIPFGQPILVGHHSEKHARADQKRIERGMDTWIEESKKADYWQDRAEGAEKAAERKARADVIKRRIDKLEADRRRMERQKAKYPASAPTAERWIRHIDKRLARERAIYEESGGILTDKVEIKAGDWVRYWGGWKQVRKVNKVTVSVSSGYSWDDKIPFDKISAVKTAAEMAETVAKSKEANGGG